MLRMNGSRASCLGSWMLAGTFHLRGLQGEEVLNGGTLRGRMLGAVLPMATVCLWYCFGSSGRCGRQSAEELTSPHFMSQMTEEFLPRSDPELELPTLSSHRGKYPSKTMAPLALTQSGEGSVCHCL